MTLGKSPKRLPDRLGMVARVALFAMTVSVFAGEYALAEQGAQNPQQTTIQQQPKKQTQTQKQLQGNQTFQQMQQQNAPKQQQVNQAAQPPKLKQVEQQQQKQAELLQQQKLQQQLQQQKQAQQTQQQLLKQQQQTQQQLLKQQQQKQTQQLQETKQAEKQRQQMLDQSQKQNQAQFQRFDWNTYHPGQRPPLWAQYRQNFDPRPYQWARNAPRHYEVRYLPPPGWRYQRWNYGQIYPRPYWVQPYWLTNYYQYGLEPLPYGYVWVQNGPDALAVDSFSGVILQVIYGLFASGGGLL
jgi:Nickel/cobalt transporter regulator